MYILLNLLLFVCLMGFLYKLQHQHLSFTKRVFIALGLGISFGGWLQFITTPETLTAHLEYVNLIGGGYVKLLQMIIMPLIIVSIVCSILKLKDGNSLGKISFVTLSVLLVTTAIAALIGIGWAALFGLSADGLVAGAAEHTRGMLLEQNLAKMAPLSISQLLLDFIPTNPFLDLTGARKTSTIAVVIFSVFIGISATGIAKKQPELFDKIDGFFQAAKALVMRMVTLVLRLTPYGIMALMAKMIATANYSDIINLANFVLASYGALISMFVLHLIIISVAGLNPLTHLKKILPVLAFAFSSRSSAATIPLNVQTQEKALGIPSEIANFAASFGATIGQNGCAGIYPAMLAVMIAPTLGINPFDFQFIATLVLLICVSSFGVAGVGGGATFAALIVLSTLNFPVALAGLLISVEPLIDMGRTALNVSGAITAGSVTSKLLHKTDMTVFNQEQILEIDAQTR